MSQEERTWYLHVNFIMNIFNWGKRLNISCLQTPNTAEERWDLQVFHNDHFKKQLVQHDIKRWIALKYPPDHACLLLHVTARFDSDEDTEIQLSRLQEQPKMIMPFWNYRKKCEKLPCSTMPGEKYIKGNEEEESWQTLAKLIPDKSR